jgi:hypothetical protein
MPLVRNYSKQGDFRSHSWQTATPITGEKGAVRVEDGKRVNGSAKVPAALTSKGAATEYRKVAVVDHNGEIYTIPLATAGDGSRSFRGATVADLGDAGTWNVHVSVSVPKQRGGNVTVTARVFQGGAVDEIQDLDDMAEEALAKVESMSTEELLAAAKHADPGTVVGKAVIAMAAEATANA